MPTSKQIFGLLGATQDLVSAGTNLIDDARRREAQVRLLELQPKLRADLYGGFDKLRKDPSLDPEEWDRAWAQGAKDSGERLLEADWDSIIKAEKNPYVRDALQKDLTDTRFSIGQHIADRRQDYVNGRTVAQGTRVMMEALQDPAADPAATASLITETMRSLAPIMAPERYEELGRSLASVYTIDAVEDVARRAMAEWKAANPDADPLEGIAAVRGAVDAMGPVELMGKPIAIPGELKAKAIDQFAGELKDESAVARALRAAEVERLEGAITAGAENPLWDDRGGLSALKIALQKGISKPDAFIKDQKTVAAIEALRTRYGAEAGVMVRRIDQRIDELDAERAAAEKAGTPKPPSTEEKRSQVFSMFMAKYAGGATVDSIRAEARDLIVEAGPDAGAVNSALVDFENRVDGDVAGLTQYQAAMGVLVTAAGKNGELLKRTTETFKNALARGADGKRVDPSLFEDIARDIAKPVLAKTVGELVDDYNSPSGNRVSFGSSEGAWAFSGEQDAGKAEGALIERILSDALAFSAVQGKDRKDWSVAPGQVGLVFENKRTGERLAVYKNEKGEVVTDRATKEGSVESLGPVASSSPARKLEVVKENIQSRLYPAGRSPYGKTEVAQKDARAAAEYVRDALVRGDLGVQPSDIAKSGIDPAVYALGLILRPSMAKTVDEIRRETEMVQTLLKLAQTSPLWKTLQPEFDKAIMERK